MKLAVISDIHSNIAALTAVAADIAQWQPDQVVVAGDIVNRGPMPRQCLEFVLARQVTEGWQLLRGNHEEYVLSIVADPSPRTGAEEAVRESVRWTAAQLDGVEAIAALPAIFETIAPDGGAVRIVHASMRSSRDNVLIDTPDDELRLKIAPAPRLFCCGHTHRPLIRMLDQTLVVNVGSVGMPFDGDTRASYSRLTWRKSGWHAEIARLDYNRDQAASDFETSGFLSQAGPLAPIIFAEFRYALPRLSTWFARYNQPLLAGALSAEQSVTAFLADMPV